jgi:hypothetical protein
VRSHWLVYVVALASGCTAVLAYPGDVAEDCFAAGDQDLDALDDAHDPDCQRVGARCDPSASDCARASLVCAATGDDREHACVPSCAAAACPDGWRCESGACACTPCVERCNGHDDDCDGRVDEAGCALGETCTAGACTCPGRTVRVPGALDLLFVIDSSGSMADERGVFATAIQNAMPALTSGDLDGDGMQDVAAVASLHLGVVTTDLGVGAGIAVAGCDAMGDDAVLGAGTGCPGTPVYFYEAYRDSAEMVGRTFASCGLAVATDGCGFAQPLDAALLAVSPGAASSTTAPGYVPSLFHDGTTGHGDTTNDAFLRPDSTLGIVIVTNGDDCSAGTDTGFYDPSDPRFAPFAGTRCNQFEDALEPLSHVVTQLVTLRRNPESVFVAAIAGIPRGTGTTPPAELLAMPAMQLVMIDESHFAPACTSAHGDATPSRRLVELAGRLECAGADAALASICDDTYDAAFRDILRAVSGASARRACVSGP